MTKEEIEKKLMDNYIRPQDRWRKYDEAKGLICGNEPITASEYEFRIKVISEYLKI